MMAKILRLQDEQTKKARHTGAGIDKVLPFGEANREVIAEQFGQGSLVPLTDEIKKKDMDYLRSLSQSENR